MIGSFNHWLGEFYRRHHHDLVRFAARLVGDRENGEEVVQNAYLRLAGRASHLVAVEHPRAYMFAATRTAAVDFSARQHAEWLHRVDLGAIEDVAQDEAALQSLASRQRILRMAVLLNELPSACRTAFILNKVEGRSHREVATRLGVSVSMVEKHIMRALTHCRDVMRDEADMQDG